MPRDRDGRKRLKAIAFFQNGLGNFILMMPSLAAVASMTDAGKIDICTDDNWKDCRRPAVKLLCESWDVVGKFISYPSDRLNPKDYNLWYFTPHGVNGSGVVNIFRNNIPNIVSRPRWRQSEIHESKHYEAIARSMGYENEFPIVNFPIAGAPVLDLPRPIIGLCNGYFRVSNHYWDAKGWPHFQHFSKTANRYFGGSMVGIGLENELPRDIQLTIDFTGKLNILETAKVISQLDLLVTTDTGLMHLANLIKVPMIALFGPTLTTKNAPTAESSMVLQAGNSCAPCQDSVRWFKCETNDCMQKIVVGDVMALAQEKLRRKP
jgi:hypothetical protein